MPSFSITGTECNSFLTKLLADLGASPLIKIYSGTKPAVADTANAGTILATLTCSGSPVFTVATNASTNAVATFNAITSATAAATGTASFFDLTTSGGTVIARGDVGTSTQSLVLNTTAVTSGSTVAITSATITMPVGN
jgi:hypothetical protein